MFSCAGRLIGCPLMLKLDTYVSKVEYLFYGIASVYFLSTFFMMYGLKDVFLENKKAEAE